MKRIITLGIIALLICSGCAWFNPKAEPTAQELAEEGKNKFDKKNYRYAIQVFEKLRDWYPFSELAILAELKIAEAHFNLKQYEEAVIEYQAFENLHPRNELIPYIIYKTGLCYFNRVDTVDRDQTSAKKALDTFNRLMIQFPENEYANKSQAHIKKCLKNLAGNELYVALYYYKKKHYKAALHRFKSILADYPDVGVHYKASHYIALCEELLKQQSYSKKDANKS